MDTQIVNISPTPQIGPAWQPDTVYDGTTSSPSTLGIITPGGARSLWKNEGSTGTSGSTQPSFTSSPQLDAAVTWTEISPPAPNVGPTTALVFTIRGTSGPIRQLFILLETATNEAIYTSGSFTPNYAAGSSIVATGNDTVITVVRAAPWQAGPGLFYVYVDALENFVWNVGPAWALNYTPVPPVPAPTFKITQQAPPPGTQPLPLQALQVLVTDLSGSSRPFYLQNNIRALALTEQVWDGTTFGPFYVAGSSVTVIDSNDTQLTLVRAGGWPAAFTLNAYPLSLT